MERIVQVLVEKYHPAGIVLYGSYGDGTYDAQSDFDALLIVGSGEQFHDTGMIEDVRMDVFGYPSSYLHDSANPDEFVQIHGGRVILDEDGAAAKLMETVRQYVEKSAERTKEEKRALSDWCHKMLARAERTDPEGQYRAHWLMTESLSVYCEMRDRFYFGPKKTIALLKKEDIPGYRLFCAALRVPEALKPWIDYILENNPQEE